MIDALKVLITDDETLARSRLCDLLNDIAQVNIVGEAKNGKEALRLAEETQADIVLLDIRMPQMDGIEVAQHLQKLNMPPAVIFTTAYDDYAIQAFEINAIDYLLKPIRLERLQTAIQKVQALRPTQLAALKPLQKQRSHFSVHERGRVLLIPVAEVIYLRAELKYTTLRTKEKEYLIDDSLISLEQEFADTFLRLHRNCLVAQASIAGYEKRQHGDQEADQNQNEAACIVLLKDLDEVIPVSRRQQHLLKQFVKTG